MLVRSDRGLLGRHARLLPSGHVGGCVADEVRRWEVIDGHLVFLDAVGRRMVVFAEAEVADDGMMMLQGAVRGAEGAIYLLRERDALSRIADDAGDIQVMRSAVMASGSAGPRRNLVVLRANEHSLHNGWKRDIAGEDRNWDLCVSFYGKEENFPPADFAEYHVLQNRDQKFASIHKLMYRGNPFWDYAYFMFPDDDLMMSWSGINRLFETTRSFGLHLAQPALLPEGFVYHPIVAQNPAFRVRFTNFVEIMTPIFSRCALEICIPTFADSPRGFGLDFVWPSQLGDRPGRIAIIDEVGVLHGRPLGGNYDVAHGNQERIKVMDDYGCSWNIQQRGAIV